VEQNRLDDAERMYRKCLEIDKNDQRALGEILHVRTLRGRHPASNR